MPRIDTREYYKKDVKDLTPIEFEDCCLLILRGYAEEERCDNFVISHNKIVKAHDGDYQVDVYAEFTVFGGSKIKVLVECKQYNSSVKRERVELLYSRLQSTGCHKGILMATTQFQSGAIQFAEEHGISLIEVMNTCDKFYSYASAPDSADCIPFEQELLHHYSVYYAQMVTGQKKQVYPTSSMISGYIDEINSERGPRSNG